MIGKRPGVYYDPCKIDIYMDLNGTIQAPKISISELGVGYYSRNNPMVVRNFVSPDRVETIFDSLSIPIALILLQRL